MERKYYTINEETARTAKNINSFSSYEPGAATEEYKSHCDKVYRIVEKIAENKPDLLEKAEYMTDRYCRKLAEYYNDYYRNEASCPSIMICGGGNFPVRKKDKQNNRRETLMETWCYLQGYAGKIENLLTQEQPILAGDENAIELLEDKIAKLEAEHKSKMEMNKYYRKNGTFKGCEGLTDKQITELEGMITRCPYLAKSPISVCNDTANIRRYKRRLESLKKVKETSPEESITEDTEGNELFKVVKNTEIMRLQLFFDGKPSDEIRDILKHNAFKWSPKNSAWQRQLTDNALYGLKRVTEAIQEVG